jgi:hypothetical protein
VPGVGLAAPAAVVFVYAYIDYGTKGYAEDHNYTKPWHGIEIPVLIGIGGLVLGGVLMQLSLRPSRRFFGRRPYFEAATPTALQDPPSYDAVVIDDEASVPE